MVTIVSRARMERMHISSRFGKVNPLSKSYISDICFSSEIKNITINCITACVTFYFLEPRSKAVIRFSKSL